MSSLSLHSEYPLPQFSTSQPLPSSSSSSSSSSKTEKSLEPPYYCQQQASYELRTMTSSSSNSSQSEPSLYEGIDAPPSYEEINRRSEIRLTLAASITTLSLTLFLISSSLSFYLLLLDPHSLTNSIISSGSPSIASEGLVGNGIGIGVNGSGGGGEWNSTNLCTLVLFGFSVLSSLGLWGVLRYKSKLELESQSGRWVVL